MAPVVVPVVIFVGFALAGGLLFWSWWKKKPDFTYMNVMVRYDNGAYHDREWDEGVKKMLRAIVLAAQDFEYEPGKKWTSDQVLGALKGLQVIFYPVGYILQPRTVSAVLHTQTYKGYYDTESVLLWSRPTAFLVQKAGMSPQTVADVVPTGLRHEIGVHRLPDKLLNNVNANHDPRFDVITQKSGEYYYKPTT